MAASDSESTAAPVTDEAVPEQTEVRAASEAEGPWRPPPAQPLRIGASILMIAASAALYGYVLSSFWSSPLLGIHDRVPYPAYALIAAAMLMALGGLRAGLGIWSPHTKLAISILAFGACVAIGMGGGRFVSYTLRGSLNPPFTLKLSPGDRFPDFALQDQRGATHRAQDVKQATLVVVYRGDFCPFSRYQLAELTAHEQEFRAAGVNLIAISADPPQRSRMLSDFLGTDIPLLCDPAESTLAPLGLIEHHRDGRPDNSVPAYFVLDSGHTVRWLWTSPYYRELPTIATLLDAARSVRDSH
ncbi:MAG: peroxiredoxin family protein [Candidatus Binataceae bacterium]